MLPLVRVCGDCLMQRCLPSLLTPSFSASRLIYTNGDDLFIARSDYFVPRCSCFASVLGIEIILCTLPFASMANIGSHIPTDLCDDNASFPLNHVTFFILHFAMMFIIGAFTLH